MDRDYAPLTAQVVRALGDKVYDKRKSAALEIEKLVRDYMTNNNHDQIRRLINVLEEFALSQNPHTRKGGLIGLAAVAIGSGNKVSFIQPYMSDLINPILACFADSNPNVRYYATESLYNVVRVGRGGVLGQFNEIFGVLVCLAMDNDTNVKNGSEMLDRMMKDIVTESPTFDLVSFIPVLRDKLYTTNCWSQTLVISWVSVLHTVPDVDVLAFLSDILDGLFFILESPKNEVKKMCENVIAEFLISCKKAPDKVKFSKIVNILIVHAQSPDNLVRLIALTWIREFITLSGRSILCHTSGILSVSLPCVSLEQEENVNIAKTKNLAEEISSCLLSLITVEDDREQPDGSTDENSSQASAAAPNGHPYESEALDLPQVMDVLMKHLRNTPVASKITALRWIQHFHECIPNKMCRYLEEVSQVLLKTLSDKSDEVVLLVVQVLAQIANMATFVPEVRGVGEGRSDDPSSPSINGQSRKGECESPKEYFTYFLQNLLRIFATDRNLLENKGPFIIRELCALLDAQDIYLTIAKLLQDEGDLSFATVMVQQLSSILLTAKELFHLRLLLRDLSSKENCELFVQLYRCWCHSPVATLTLCLLTQNYDHAAQLVQVFADIEISTELLVEVDKLVQLIESPIFISLRLDLLNPVKNNSLIAALYGLLMVLPQSDAFQLLRCRLNCLPPTHLIKSSDSTSQTKETIPIDFEDLLHHFQETQKLHQEYRINTIRQRLKCNSIDT